MGPRARRRRRSRAHRAEADALVAEAQREAAAIPGSRGDRGRRARVRDRPSAGDRRQRAGDRSSACRATRRRRSLRSPNPRGPLAHAGPRDRKAAKPEGRSDNGDPTMTARRPTHAGPKQTSPMSSAALRCQAGQAMTRRSVGRRSPTEETRRRAELDHELFELRDRAERETTELRETTERETTELRGDHGARRQPTCGKPPEQHPLCRRATLPERSRCAPEMKIARKEVADLSTRPPRTDLAALRQTAEQTGPSTLEPRWSGRRQRQRSTLADERLRKARGPARARCGSRIGPASNARQNRPAPTQRSSSVSRRDRGRERAPRPSAERPSPRTQRLSGRGDGQLHRGRRSRAAAVRRGGRATSSGPSRHDARAAA